MRFFLIAVLLLFSSFSVNAQSQSAAQDESADAILKKANDLMNQESSEAVITMTIKTSGGELRTFEYKSYSKDKGEKNLMKYVSPRKMKDQSILMLNSADDIWVYFPRTNRVRKLASHAKKQKMEGSDFSYEDLGSGNSFINDFTCKKLDDAESDGDKCYVLELAKKEDGDSGYSRLVMYVRKKDYVIVIIKYYDEKSPDFQTKELVCSDIRDIQGVPTATKLTMNNRLDNSNTKMEIKNIKYDVSLKDALFTENGMKK